MSLSLFDTHAHLDQNEFDADRDAVVDRARQAGLEAIVAVGTTAESSAASVELAARYDIVHAAVGIQPNYCSEAKPGDWDRIVALADQPKVVALGETGLDGYWDHAPLELQRDYFDRHLRLSAQRRLPFIVHMRNSAVDVLAMLREAFERDGPLLGVMHSFTIDSTLGEPALGDPMIEEAEKMVAECVAMGLFISFAGMATFKKADDLRCVARSVPNDRILIETDSPYLAPHPHRGKRNEPALVVHTAERLALERGVALQQFAAQTTANARSLFGLGAKLF